jgi:hypothetical protein
MSAPVKWYCAHRYNAKPYEREFVKETVARLYCSPAVFVNKKGKYESWHSTLEAAQVAIEEWQRQDKIRARAFQVRAAAPDMLAALQAANAYYGPFGEITVNNNHDEEDVRVASLMRAAIAKATS